MYKTAKPNKAIIPTPPFIMRTTDSINNIVVNPDVSADNLCVDVNTTFSETVSICEKVKMSKGFEAEDPITVGKFIRFESDKSTMLDIADIPTDTVEKLMDVTPRIYVDKNDPVFLDENGIPLCDTSSSETPTNHYGFVADDLEKIYPNLVIETTTPSCPCIVKKHISYPEFIPLIIKKIQTMQGLIDSLTEEITTLKQSNIERDAIIAALCDDVDSLMP